MPEETLILLTLTVVMLVGSYLAGSIPLVMRLSEEKLKTITILGAGLLVGTALTVIIPEGINSLYMKDNDMVQQQQQHLDVIHHSSLAPLQEQHLHVHQYAKNNHARTIGLSLVLGFVFMMLVDHISQTAENITATLGLVVHAAADGVALGAAATTSHQDVEIIVFLAIMLHKAPAAFGLVSFLLHERIDRQEIRKHLAIFSVSAPLFTLLTYFGIGQEQKETLNSVNATGIAMLFSAGTFLYVATVHVLPELTHNNNNNNNNHHHHHHHHATTTKRNVDQHDYHILMSEDVSAENIEIPTTSANALKIAAANAQEVEIVNQRHHSKQNKGLRFSQLIIMITGALMPLIITFGHSH